MSETMNMQNLCGGTARLVKEPLLPDAAAGAILAARAEKESQA